MFLVIFFVLCSYCLCWHLCVACYGCLVCDVPLLCGARTWCGWLFNACFTYNVMFYILLESGGGGWKNTINSIWINLFSLGLALFAADVSLLS